MIGRFCNCSFLVRPVYDYLGQSRRIERGTELNLDDRTYSSGDWLARFVPTANICTAANDVHGAMIPITSSARKQLADYGGSPACMSAAQACLLFGPSRRLSMYAAIDRRGLSNGLPSGFMEAAVCLSAAAQQAASHR